MAIVHSEVINPPLLTKVDSLKGKVKTHLNKQIKPLKAQITHKNPVLKVSLLRNVSHWSRMKKDQVSELNTRRIKQACMF